VDSNKTIRPSSDSGAAVKSWLQWSRRGRMWVTGLLEPSEWHGTLFWAGLVGFLGALASIAFREALSWLHLWVTGSAAGLVASFQLLPPWRRLVTPALGGLAAGAILLLGTRIARGASTTDYLEAILIGDGRVSSRSSLVKSLAALFSIASGSSIGREGPMVQLSAMVASLAGRLRGFVRPHLRLLVACGSAAGIASAYNAPIAGSLFVAEIILGTIAIESLGPLAFSAVVATLTVRGISGVHRLYDVPAFTLHSAWEMIPYFVLAMAAGTMAPFFVRSLRWGERLFVASRLPVLMRLALGGLVVGALAIRVPQVCGNGYSMVLTVLNGDLAWQTLLLVFACKWLATATSFGSGAPGGVFTPTLFMGASLGYLYGTGVHHVWPGGAVDPRAFALVGMGAFLSAATHAPLMALVMLFELTLSYDIILPLMMGSVVAYYAARGIEGASIYSEALRRKAAAQAAAGSLPAAVGDLMRPDPPSVPETTPFEEIARMFVTAETNHLYVIGRDGGFAGAVSLHDMQPYLNDPGLAELVIAEDIVHGDFPYVTPADSLAQALDSFARRRDLERLPVLADEKSRRLVGSLSKLDLLLAIADARRPPAESAP
jgi:chloride channel protein, CIC family